MKNLYRLSCVIFLVITCLLTACQNDLKSLSIIEDPVPNQHRPSVNKGIELIIDSSKYDKNAISIKATIMNDSNVDCEYGEFFMIEIMIDGYWHIVNYSDYIFLSNHKFIDLGMILRSGDSITQIFEPENYGLTLPAGQYRLTKTVSCPFPRGNEITVSVPFEVE